ncbi:GIY-YIG nuclease family protein [Ensifer sesbaniae]|uniref:GIY-YIG nuclease family protein n=1 Tax=Ensifer sesbaniae TaxID=1214071 RepID=UPI002000EFBF|nr:GIY-YIG nuclease family protein [Ensifer sesbaniae]
MEINIETNCGVYELRHNSSNTAYCGSSLNVNRRKREHLRKLFLNCHANYRLQDAYNESAGNTAFSFKVLVYCTPNERKDIEQMYLDSGKYELNIATNAEGGSGPMSEEGRERLANSKRGKPRSAEIKRKISDTKSVGKYITPIGQFSSRRQAERAFNGLMAGITITQICTAPDTIISAFAYGKSRYLKTHHDRSVIGSSWRSLGFGFEPANPSASCEGGGC